MTNEFKDILEFRQLYYFAVVAEELNLHRAAERLFISQPPLSRQIKQFEERLGVTLFNRHTRGMTLTEDGAAVLEQIRPLLALHDSTLESLRQLAKTQKPGLTVGFTTAFEQGVFVALEAELQAVYGSQLRMVRSSSSKLVHEVKKGRVDLAFVALPLATQGVPATPLGYEEPHLAALPESWPEAGSKELRLKDLNDKPVFWFRREANTAFYDFAKSVFTQTEFTPVFKDEPAEHDVLLARIASGEAAGLFPASFSVIRRQGVVYTPFREGESLRVRLGIIAMESKNALLESLLKIALQKLPVKR